MYCIRANIDMIPMMLTNNARKWLVNSVSSGRSRWAMFIFINRWSNECKIMRAEGSISKYFLTSINKLESKIDFLICNPFAVFNQVLLKFMIQTRGLEIPFE